MRSYPIFAALSAAVSAAILTGCSAGSDESQPAATSPATTTMTTDARTAAPGAVGVSPNGVTTALGAPAESTEDEYFQACRAAKAWMTERGGDPKALFEPYLQDLQSSDAAGPGTFDLPWSRLPPPRQAAVVVAAEAAADDLCG